MVEDKPHPYIFYKLYATKVKKKRINKKYILINERF